MKKGLDMKKGLEKYGDDHGSPTKEVTDYLKEKGWNSLARLLTERPCPTLETRFMLEEMFWED